MIAFNLNLRGCLDTQPAADSDHSDGIQMGSDVVLPANCCGATHPNLESCCSR